MMLLTKEIRWLSDLRYVAFDSEWLEFALNREAYYKHRDPALTPEDAAVIKQRKLRYASL